MLTNAKTIESCELRAADGPLGRLADLYFDHAEWRIRYLVVRTAPALSDRTTLISAAAVSRCDWNDRVIDVDLTGQQVRNSPPFDTAKPVSREHQEALHRYYGWPIYWDAPLFAPGYVPPVDPAAAPLATTAAANTFTRFPEARPGDAPAANERAALESGSHLRSTQAVRGYHIEALDGTVGHLEDLVVDDATWEVRYLLVDTRNWWPGKKVVVPPQLVREIRWVDSTVLVDLPRERIKAAPEFDDRRLLAADYVDRLEAHYAPARRANRAR